MQEQQHPEENIKQQLMDFIADIFKGFFGEIHHCFNIGMVCSFEEIIDAFRYYLPIT